MAGLQYTNQWLPYILIKYRNYFDSTTFQEVGQKLCNFLRCSVGELKTTQFPSGISWPYNRNALNFGEKDSNSHDTKYATMTFKKQRNPI